MNEPQAEFECGKHGVKLLNVLKGGAGWCPKCWLYVQSANHPMPQLSPEVQAKRDAAMASKGKRKKATRKRKAKPKRKAEKSTQKVHRKLPRAAVKLVSTSTITTYSESIGKVYGK